MKQEKRYVMKQEFSYKMMFIGVVGILIILAAMFLTSCQKEMYSDLDLIQQVEPEFTQSDYRMAIADAAAPYSVDDLLAMLGQYGTSTPDIVPAFNNFYNDVAGGGSYVGNLTLVNGERFFNPANQLISDTTGYVFDWYINDVFQCSEANPQFWDLDNNLDCDGVFELQLVVTTSTGAEFSRTQWFFANYNGSGIDLPTCICPECPLLFDVFYTFYPEVEPYFYQTQCATWDLDCSQHVDVNDLLILLGGYGG